MNKNQTLKIMIEELYCMERIINIKSTLITFPGKIISTREINDIKIYFEEFEKKVDKLLKSFLAEKEKEAKTKKPKTSETKERFRIIEELFEEVKNTQKNIFSKAKILFADFEKKENEIFSNDIIPRKDKVILNDGRNNNTNNENEENQKEEILIIEKIFLNTKVTINDVDILKKKPTLDDEKNFITRLLNLVELFPNCQSKQYIMLDYYMNLYNLCIENNFTLQQISTIMSIFYYMFSYSFCWISTENKIFEIYSTILNYHSINNPPFTYYIFSQSQKKLLLEYFETTFIKNFAFFEVLFRYDVSICYLNQAPKIEQNNNNNLEQNKKIDKTPIGSVSKIISEYEMEEENDEKLNENKEGNGDKSQSEIEDEKEIEAMKNFVNSFYQAVGDLEMQKARNDANALLGKNMEEANQAKLFLDIKVPEIEKDISEQVDVVTRNALKSVEQEMQERAAAKGGKK